MKGYSVPNLFGGTSYYDESGEKVGESINGLFGNTLFYNNENELFAESIPNMFGGSDYYINDPVDQIEPCYPEMDYYDF